MKRVGDLVPKFQPCEQCKDTPGFVTVMRPWGTMQVPSQARCACFLAHQQKILRAITDVAESRRKKTR
jgi:hypothetical protein